MKEKFIRILSAPVLPISAILLLCVLMFFSISSAFAEDYLVPVLSLHDDSIISREDAIKSLEYALTRDNIVISEKHKIKTCAVIFEDGTEAWIIVLDEKPDDIYDSGKDVYAVISARNGALLYIDYPRGEIATEYQKKWVQYKDSFNTWSIADRAMFNWIFGNDSALFIPADAKISESDAIQIAQEAYRKISDRKADSLSVNYFQYALDMETPLYSWVISFIVDGQNQYVFHISTETGEVLESYDLLQSIG